MASMNPIYAGILLAISAAPMAVYAQATQAFNLPAQSLAKSLRDFGSQSRINVIFDPVTIGAAQAPAVSGQYDPKQALSKLLEGTAFTAEFTGATTVVIKPKSLPPGKEENQKVNSQAKKTQQTPETTTLKTVTVLGSLLPRSQVETASPLIVITANDIKNRGFSSVADALQNATVSTGSVNNSAINAGDIWAAKTISLFGLDPSYTKFLIDGRPMPMYSQLAQSATVDQLYTNLDGIPINMVDRIEILPGGQSSLYGSDAVAGVVNIVLKKHVDAASVDARVGWYSDGGGRERMISGSDDINVGKLNVLAGIQLNDQDPMWAFQRDITAQNFAGGLGPQRPSAIAGVRKFSGVPYSPKSPADCSGLAQLWGGSVTYVPKGSYCGTNDSRGYSTLMTKSQAASITLHATYAFNDQLELYGDLLDSYEKQSHEVSSAFFGLLYDPKLRSRVTVSRNFAPEEISSNLDGLLTQTNYENTYTAQLGGKYDFENGWNLDVGFSRGLERIDDRQIALLGSRIPGSYGSAVLGPRLGTDPAGFPIYSPNYSLLENPLSPEQFAGYLGAASIASTDRNDQLRAQLTQTSLFRLPGGDAGLALVAEQGFESWKYVPSPQLSDGYLQGLSWNPSDGHRTRYATAAELNLPLFKMLTADMSARYDSYDAEGAHFSHPTYSVGLEFRPINTLLLRTKYTTSFKAPSLIDEFEGGSTALGYITDYVNCARSGDPNNPLINCPAQYFSQPATIVQTSNSSLKPMTAKTFSYGAVWSPIVNMSMSLDYQHISIHNEVLKENPGYLGKMELYCLNGVLDPSSPTCEAINAQIVRAPSTAGSQFLGPIVSEVTTKINLASEVNNAVNASFDYSTDAHQWGRLHFNFAWTKVLTHRQETFPGDPVEDLLRDPGFSTEFRTKANASVTWSMHPWSVTAYESYFGPTPNQAAISANNYTAPNTGKVPPWRIYNLSVNYSPASAWELSLRINNLKNSMPWIDRTASGSYNQPFNASNYNPYGRELFLEARYSFGGSGGH